MKRFPLTSRKAQAWLTPLALALALFLAPHIAGKSKPDDQEGKINAEQIVPQLAQFYATFVNTISATGDKLGSGEVDEQFRRRLILGKIAAVRACRTAIFQADTRNAVIDTWALCIRFRLLAESEEGRRQFGEATEELKKGTVKLQGEIESIASDFLNPEQIEATSKQLEDYSRKHSIVAGNALAAPSNGEIESGVPGVGWLFKVPLIPFKAMAGVDTSAQAIASMSRTADNLTQLASTIPLELSWESELLLMQARRDSTSLIQDVMEKTEMKTQALIDHIFWRGVQFIGAILAAGLTYRLLVTRLIQTHPTGK